jgi:enamine deaminase RidA (YjgF/YER057c/UK114 family)
VSSATTRTLRGPPGGDLIYHTPFLGQLLSNQVVIADNATCGLTKAGDGTLITGLLGAGLATGQGVDAARLCALNILAQAKAALGSLDRVAQVVRLTGFVAATPAFTDHPKVVNGASDLMVAVLGERGRHTRSAVGVASLPMNAAVEIDAILKVR